MFKDYHNSFLVRLLSVALQDNGTEVTVKVGQKFINLIGGEIRERTSYLILFLDYGENFASSNSLYRHVPITVVKCNIKPFVVTY